MTHASMSCSGSHYPPDLSCLERLRKTEIESIRHWFKPGMKVLEMGGGNGFQATIIESWGCNVTSLDLPQTLRSCKLHHPVQEYDGRTIPFPDQSFDLIFSSNVLEHVPDLANVLREIARVVKRGGVIIHILPTSTWRIWTCLSHYLFGLKLCARLMLPADGISRAYSQQIVGKKRTRAEMISRLFYAGPHGEYPNAFYEIYAFGRRRWTRLFNDRGFEVVQSVGSPIFYTGYEIFPDLSLTARRLMARMFGSASRSYIMHVSER